MTLTRLQLVPLLSNFAKHAKDTVGATHRADEMCAGEHLPAPEMIHEHHAKIPAAYTTGCGGETLFNLPVGTPDTDFEKTAPAVVCVVDDMAYMFPKYGGGDFDPPAEDDNEA